MLIGWKARKYWKVEKIFEKFEVEGDKMLEFKYDTQLLIEGNNLDEDVISEYFIANFKGDCFYIDSLFYGYKNE